MTRPSEPARPRSWSRAAQIRSALAGLVTARLVRPGPADGLAATAGIALLAVTLAGTPVRVFLTLFLSGAAALAAALVFGQRWCASLVAFAAVAGIGLPAGLRPEQASGGRIAVAALLLTAYLILADTAESRGPVFAAVRQLPVAVFATALTLLVLAVLGLPPAPYVWLAILGLLAALAAFGAVASTGMDTSAPHSDAPHSDAPHSE